MKSVTVNKGDVVDIMNCIFEILESPEAKQAMPQEDREVLEHDKTVYALIKSFRKLTPIQKAASKVENALTDDAFEASRVVKENAQLDEEEKREAFEKINTELKDKVLALYDQTVEVEIHQMPLATSNIIQKYIKGKATLVLFNHLTLEE